MGKRTSVIERLWVSFEERVMTVLKCLCGAELVVIKEGKEGKEGKILRCPVEGIIYTYPVPLDRKGQGGGMKRLRRILHIKNLRGSNNGGNDSQMQQIWGRIYGT